MDNLVSVTTNPATSLNDAYAIQDHQYGVICDLIGKIYRFDYEPEGRDKDGLRLGNFHYMDDAENTLRCFFNLKKDENYESIPTKNWSANVRNKIGALIPDRATYTIKQLNEVGIYTFDYPGQMKVSVKLFCNENKSCNSNMRMIQECKEKPLAECQGWTLQESLNWAAEQAYMNPDTYSYSIKTERGVTELEDPTTPLDAETLMMNVLLNSTISITL